MKNVLLIILMCASIFADDKKNTASTTDEEIKTYKINYSSLKDTLFTTGDYFIEVNLETQIAYLHSRYDSIKHFS